MAGITMCSNKDCPLRYRCYRAQAEPSCWQSYAMFHPKGDFCEHFYPTTREEDNAKPIL